jgi:protein-S-isoprenylcysteine O-methyltransferase Ste14
LGSRSRIDLPPVYLLLSLAAMAMFHVALPLARPIDEPYRYAGIVVAALGVALDAWALALFLRAKTGVIPFSEAKTLVVRGPYRWTRNPMYLGMAAILLGFAIYLGSVTPFIVIPAFMGLIAERFIVPEEEMLEKAFGQAYAGYKARVRRWL